MKTREYFTAKTTELKKELNESIKYLLYSKLKHGQDFCNIDESNCIDFENNVTGMEDSGMISHINIDDNIVIYPEGSDLDPIDLDCIESIHDLMLLHYMALNDLV